VIFNKHATARMETIAGRDRLLIVDEFYANPYHVREMALQRDFYPQGEEIRSSRGGFYPGSLSLLPRTIPGVDEVLDHVRGLLRDAFTIDIAASDIVTDFAVVHMQPGALVAAQRHPHADVENPVLGLVYLNPFIDSGTSFYRHRETGIHAARSEDQKRSIIDFASDPRNSRREQGYIAGSDRYWERIHSVAGVFNRFVAYSGQVLHSGDVFVPARGRLGEHRLTQRFLVFKTKDLSP
jgi:hypothetical protein